ncbi:MAG TPA: response regulator [Candidatus Kapabacteria bacterium]|nr:response regulator [Candidatus Kapabacteria bacterium]HOQ49063.1 response regulator [Candidatus Kapabacteria bacterium]HPU23723.1 response regulator [Candidatus Kapabacteria bacterium]
MSKDFNIYLIDDEKQIVFSLFKIINKLYPNIELKLFTDALSAWEALAKEENTAIVICDLIMPGMTGLQLLRKIKTTESTKNFYFIAMSSSIEPEVNIKTIQQGADDFLVKPFSVDVLLAKVRAAIRVVKMLISEDEYKEKMSEYEQELDKAAQTMIEQIKSFIEIRLPELSKRIPKIIEASEFIGKELCESMEEVENIKKAAELCFCGRIGLNEKIVETPAMTKGMVTRPEMLDIPKNSREMLSKIRGTESYEPIIYHIYENFDGTGFPEGKKGWEIPLGSRILRVALDFEEMMKKNADNAAKTIEQMFIEARRLYDHRVITFYDQYLASKEVSRVLGVRGREYVVAIHELDETMTTARHIVTESGLILVAPNVNLNEERIERIRTINRTDPILGKIYIRNK